MNIQEFTKLAGFQPTESYYHNVIEVEYMDSDIQDKAEWVKEWKKQGGIQRAYDDMVRRVGNAESSNDYHLVKIKGLNEKIDNFRQVVDAANAEAREYREKFEAVKQELFDAKNEIGVWKDNTKDLAYKLLTISEKTGSSDLRQVVISMIGFKAYIKYKFDNDMNIWQLDRDEIIKIIE